jgi:hypothetical protein
LRLPISICCVGDILIRFARVAGPPVKRDADCGTSARERTGCNIVEGKCACGSSMVCPGDLPPFTFENHSECEINFRITPGR